MNVNSNSSGFSFFDNEWTEDQFKQCRFEVISAPANSGASTSKIIDLKFEKLANAPLDHISETGAAILMTAKSIATTSLSQGAKVPDIANAFNVLVENEFAQQEQQVSKLTTVDKNIKQISEIIERNRKIERSIYSFNSIIRQYNKESGLSCPTIESLVTKVELQNRILKRRIQCLNYLKALPLNISNGLKVGVRDIAKLAIDNVIVDDTAIFEDIKPEDELYKRYYSYINMAYLKTVLDDPNVVAPSLKTLAYPLKKLGLGITEEQFQRALTITSEFLIKEYSDFEVLGEFSLAQFDKKMINDFIDKLLIVANIEPAKQGNLKRILILFQKLEREYEAEHEEQYKKLFNRYQSIVPAQIKENPEMEKIYVARWNNAPISLELPREIQQALQDSFVQRKILGKEIGFTQDTLTLPSEEFEKVFENLTVVLEKEVLTPVYDSLLMKFQDFQKKIKKDLGVSPATWNVKDTKNRNFIFSQSAWGDSAMLSEGACWGINYRWIKTLMKSPQKAITSADDLASESPTVKVLPIDRYMQINFNLALKKTQHALLAFNEIAKRDGLQAWFISEKNISKVFNRDQNSKANIFDELMELERIEPFLFYSSGVLQVALSGKGGGHAIGVQIDKEHNIYRFWDVNSGCYTYDNFEEMAEQFTCFLNEMYKDEDYDYCIFHQFARRGEELASSPLRKALETVSALYKMVRGTKNETIYDLTRAIEARAETHIKEVIDIYVDVPDEPGEEWIKDFQLLSRQTDTLRRNLLKRNEKIKAYNSKFLLAASSWLTCPNHDKTIRSLQDLQAFFQEVLGKFIEPKN